MTGRGTGLCCSLWLNDRINKLTINATKSPLETWFSRLYSCLRNMAPSVHLTGILFPQVFTWLNFWINLPETLTTSLYFIFPEALTIFLKFFFLICLFTHLSFVLCPEEQRLYGFAKQVPRQALSVVEWRL